MAALMQSREGATAGGGGFTAAVGLELHIQLATTTKIFCACPTRFGAPPNSQTCPVCLGLPGVLPRLNRRAVALALRTGAALNCKLARVSYFDRKHYFYPDLPKNYQITQYTAPFGVGGALPWEAGSGVHSVGIERMHLEEDAGRSVALADTSANSETAGAVGVDLNRAGLPLLEIVTAPELTDGASARECLVQLRRLVRYLAVSDGNLQEGNLRCDVNVSVRPVVASALGQKVELKNLNSLRAVQQGIAYEIERQTDLLRAGRRVRAETRTWDPKQRQTSVLRVKEGQDDYRYFREPDLPPLIVSEAEITAARTDLPELPLTREARLKRQYGLPAADAALMTATPELADYFEEVATRLADGRTAASWIGTEVGRLLNERSWAIGQFPISAERLASLLALVVSGELTATLAKAVQNEMLSDPASAVQIVHRHGWAPLRDEESLQPIVARTLDEHSRAVADYHAGKESLMEFFVGQVMRATAGRAHPAVVRRLLQAALAKRADG